MCCTCMPIGEMGGGPSSVYPSVGEGEAATLRPLDGGDWAVAAFLPTRF